MNTKYLAEYRSTETSQSGCVHSFAPIAREDQEFAPQVEHYCPLCEKKHRFRLWNVHIVATEKQMKSFLDWCEANQIQRGVKLN